MYVSKKGKRELRVHHQLSNGQHITIFVKLKKHYYDPTPYLIASIGLVISKNKRHCNDWWNCKISNRTRKIRNHATGKSGLEGLMWARKTLRELERYLLEHYHLPLWIKIGWTNEQRLIVYRRLERDGYHFIYWHGDSLMKTIREYPHHNPLLME